MLIVEFLVLVAVLLFEPAMKAAVLPSRHMMLMGCIVLGIQVLMPGAVLCVQIIVKGLMLVVSRCNHGHD